MNKTIYVGIIGAVVVFISGAGVVAAEGHLNEAIHLLPESQVATSTPLKESNENESVTAASTSNGDASEKNTVSTPGSESEHAQTRGGDQSEADRVLSSTARGDGQGEGDSNNESEDESDDSGFSGGTPQPAVTQTATVPSGQTLTLVQVAAHANASSCYTAIGGSVYDLTSFIGSHRGGQASILSLCGVDGTAAFNAQHGGQGNPAAELASLKIGTLI